MSLPPHSAAAPGVGRGAVALALALLAVWQTGSPSLAQAPPTGVDRSALRFERAVQATRAGLNCAVVDPAIFPHATGSLRDLRLLGSDGREVPFVLTLSGTGQEDVVTARAIVSHGSGVSFDLPMPPRAYTDVVLDLAATDFVARADVVAETGASLGHYAVWDLHREGLGRSTILHLQEEHAPVLHVTLAPVSGTLRPADVRGATVPPTRDTETLFTPAVRSTKLEQLSGATVATLLLPPRMPIERLRVVLGPGAGDFHRAVRIDARPIGEHDRETLTGEIDRLHTVRSGLALDDDHLLLPATLGANLGGPAEVRVTISNGAAGPLPIRALELDTRERQLCFDAHAAGEQLTLLYGDPHLHAPAYGDYTRRYVAEHGVAPALLGSERSNPVFVTESEPQTLWQQHPRIVGGALLLGACLLLGGLLHSDRRGRV